MNRLRARSAWMVMGSRLTLRPFCWRRNIGASQQIPSAYSAEISSAQCRKGSGACSQFGSALRAIRCFCRSRGRLIDVTSREEVIAAPERTKIFRGRVVKPDYEFINPSRRIRKPTSSERIFSEPSAGITRVARALPLTSGTVSWCPIL